MQVVGRREKRVVSFTGLTELDTSEKYIFQISHKMLRNVKSLSPEPKEIADKVKSISGRMTFATRD
jgi:hypothetical protein